MITPIIIPIHSGSSSNKPDNKCPKCGHEWNNESKPMSFKGRVITTIIVFIALYFIVGLFEGLNSGVMYNALFVRSVDNYEVPEGWKILSNNKGKYIIKKGDKFLTRTEKLKLTLCNYPNIYNPLKCASEKRAKSTLKHYLDKTELNTFK